MLGSFWDHFSFILKSFWDKSGIIVASSRIYYLAHCPALNDYWIKFKKNSETHAKPHTHARKQARMDAHTGTHTFDDSWPSASRRLAFRQPRHCGPPHNVRTQSGNPTMSKRQDKFTFWSPRPLKLECWGVDPNFNTYFSYRLWRCV